MSPVLLASACAASFAGVFLGVLGLRKITLGAVQKLVAVMLYLMGGLLALGLV